MITNYFVRLSACTALALVVACDAESSSPGQVPSSGGGSATSAGSQTSTGVAPGASTGEPTSSVDPATSGGAPGTAGGIVPGGTSAGTASTGTTTTPSGSETTGDSTGADTGGGSDVPAPIDCGRVTATGYALCDASDAHCGVVFEDAAGCTAVCAAAGLTCVRAWENVESECAADMAQSELPCDSGHQSDYCECGGPQLGDPGQVDPGAFDAGVTADSGTTDSTDGMPTSIRLGDPVPGWAGVATSSQPQGATGGGSDLSRAVTVSTMGALQDAVSGSSPAIVLVEPGPYRGELRPGANKTIVGKAPGVVIEGSVRISGSEVFNVVVRNLAVRGDRCSSYEACKAGADAVYIGDDAHHVWLDHVDIADGQDGNCDVTQAGDYVTVSWSKFHYTYDKEHRFSNLIAGSDSETRSRGKLRISYLRDWWGDRVEQRSPRGRFGKVHMLNNYHSSKDTSYVAGPGVEAQFLVENCFYEINAGAPAFSSYGDSAAWKGVGNEGNAAGMNSSQGSVFTPPYDYEEWPASAVKAALTSPNCGAGNTCQLE